MADCLNALVSVKKKQQLSDIFINNRDVITIDHSYFNVMALFFSLDSLLREFQTFSNFITGSRATYRNLLKSYLKCSQKKNFLLFAKPSTALF